MRVHVTFDTAMIVAVCIRRLSATSVMCICQVQHHGRSAEATGSEFHGSVQTNMQLLRLLTVHELPYALNSLSVFTELHK